MLREQRENTLKNIFYEFGKSYVGREYGIRETQYDYMLPKYKKAKILMNQYLNEFKKQVNTNLSNYNKEHPDDKVKIKFKSHKKEVNKKDNILYYMTSLDYIMLDKNNKEILKEKNNIITDAEDKLLRLIEKGNEDLRTEYCKDFIRADMDYNRQTLITDLMR